jgi:hypothetical protein
MILEKFKKSTHSGTFVVPPDKSLHGELTLAGSKTALYLQDEDYFELRGVPSLCVKGVLHDLTRVTLIDCISSGTGSATRGAEGYYFSTLFPHFAVFGDSHISPNENVITAVHFLIDDAATLFYDFDAFGHVIDARPFIEQIAHANAFNREIKTGPDPRILYFTGKSEIFQTDTIFGKVSASHCPTFNLGGPAGVYLKNRIITSVVFEEGVDFSEAIFRASTLVRYFGMLVGRPQNLLDLRVSLESNSDGPRLLGVYWSMPPKRKKSDEVSKPHCSDVLLDPIRKPQEFSNVLRRWLDRQKDWTGARFRFFNSFGRQRHYDIDRLIGAANMFDVLPDSAVPPDLELTQELNAARSAASELFSGLPESPERDSILSALGRVGKSSLKQKIRYRAMALIDIAGSRFPELSWVLGEAVNCRNYYVHGTRPRFDYDRNFDAVTFFTDTLEFVFATSDLIEAGWDINAQLSTGTSMSHPFRRYPFTYLPSLGLLKRLLPRALG